MRRWWCGHLSHCSTGGTSPLCDHLLPSKRQPRDTAKGEGSDGPLTPPSPSPQPRVLRSRSRIEQWMGRWEHHDIRTSRNRGPYLPSGNPVPMFTFNRIFLIVKATRCARLNVPTMLNCVAL